MNGIKAKKFSVRSLAYLMVIVLAIFSLEWIVTHRKPIDATLIRGHDTPYQVVTEGQLKGLVQNHFKLNLKNQNFEPLEVRLNLSAIPNDVKVIAPFEKVILAPGELQRYPVFVYFPESLTKGKGTGKVELILDLQKTSSAEMDKVVEEVPLVGPF
jgi:hypothetical protein